MQRKGSALFLFVTTACLIFMFPKNILADSSCSLTVHSYISQNGDESAGTYAVSQSIPDDASPLSGAVYSLWKVGDVILKSLGGTVTPCACHVDDEFMELLISGGMSPDNRHDEEEPYYPMAAIQETWAMASKDEAALTERVRTCGITLPPSDIDGEARAEDLSEGLYILAITQIPDREDLRILQGHAPILLMLPQLNQEAIGPEGELEDPDRLWIYDVSVYPKSRTLESGKKLLLSDMSLKEADDRETGSTITFISYVNLPNLGDSDKYNAAALNDNMSDGLWHQKIDKVVCGTWLREDDLSYDIINTYRELSPDVDYKVADGDHGFNLALTEEGIEKVNTLTDNSGIYVIYDALLGPNATAGTDGPDANESIWTVSTDRTGGSYTLRSPLARVASYGIDLVKKGLSDASEARFCISISNNLLYFQKSGEGTYLIQGTDAAYEGSVSLLAPAPDGHLRILGLDSASYTITETKTESGHNLLTSPFTVTLNGEPAVGSLVSAELSLDSDAPIPLTISAVNGGIAEITVSNEVMITPLKAGDNGYWKVAAFIFVFGIMLLGALLIRKRRLDR